MRTIVLVVTSSQPCEANESMSTYGSLCFSAQASTIHANSYGFAVCCMDFRNRTGLWA